jgi:hypothetical protein
LLPEFACWRRGRDGGVSVAGGDRGGFHGHKFEETDALLGGCRNGVSRCGQRSVPPIGSEIPVQEVFQALLLA